MAQPFPVIGIVGKRGDPGVADTVRRVAQAIRDRDRQVVVDAATAHHLPDWSGDVVDRHAIGEACDLVMVVGGDGTLLDAGRAVALHDTPLLGINLGRLGFLVDILPDQMERTLDKVLAGDFVRDRRLLLTARVEHTDGSCAGPFLALNDVVIRNAEFARVLEFDTFMDGSFISRHRADGLIVATPTGSTAYALSGGGPVLHPGLNALALVPICPHTLSDRPLVIDGRHEVGIVIGATNRSQALFTVDGQESETLVPGDRVTVARADRELTLIHPPGYDYYNILRNKLQWGRGQRDPLTGH
ncbi:NAD(+) kinase [Spectribacter hydrogenoxidans]|uniref:NAD kinase n=1 Tax=Spectribacter hydrogenoxidans TaxID=3075608 RepID=A0ABU3BXH5_9GAMM|nr:NAD(+) kinase [Salinisphaera sp. W335]MDT0634014.1 NAD(+) kinase [Salinisphaera sp. W335]